MPNINNKNQEEIEDIFDSPQDAKQPQTKEALPEPQPEFQEEPAQEQIPENVEYKKPFPFKIIFIVLAILIILSGVVLGGFFYYQKVYLPQKNTTINLNQNINLLPITPVNSNLNSGIVANTNTEVIKDTDFDGLTDDEEKEYNTDIKKVDTDNDGLSDREEVKVYLTDPRDEDTDNDSYSDGDEVKNFFNPNGKGKLYNLQDEINKLNSSN